MKCLACDTILTDVEAVRKDQYGEFIDLCYWCSSQQEQSNILTELGFSHKLNKFREENETE